MSHFVFHGKMQWEHSHLWTRKQVFTRYRICQHLDLWTLQFSELWETNVHCLSYTDYGILVTAIQTDYHRCQEVECHSGKLTNLCTSLENIQDYLAETAVISAAYFLSFLTGCGLTTPLSSLPASSFSGFAKWPCFARPRPDSLYHFMCMS